MTHFTAKLLDGRVLTDKDFPSISLLPLAEVTEISVRAEDAAPVVLHADVAAGERVYFFTRTSLTVGDSSKVKISVPVYEIRKDEKTVCRLYWHPDTGPILTSKDLYF